MFFSFKTIPEKTKLLFLRWSLTLGLFLTRKKKLYSCLWDSTSSRDFQLKCVCIGSHFVADSQIIMVLKLSVRKYFVAPHKNTPTKAIRIMSHNICFYGKARKVTGSPEMLLKCTLHQRLCISDVRKLGSVHKHDWCAH